MGPYFGAYSASTGGSTGTTNTILNGVGTPSPALGNNGDFYIDTAISKMYGPKTSGVWGSGTSLIGAPGAAGVGVPVAGTVNQVLKKNSSTDYDTSWVTPGNLLLVETRDTNTPNATVPSHNLLATGSETNIDAAIVPKGTGAFQLAIPDNGTTGGNKRGAGAVDLQTNRNANTQVASGANSIVAGMRSTASGANSVAMGNNANATNTNAISLGTSNSSTGSNSISIGGSCVSSGVSSVALGSACSSTGASSIAMGSNSITGAIAGRFCHSSGQNNGEGQFSFWDLKNATTNATPTQLVMGAGGAATAATRILLTNNTAFAFTGTLLAKQQGSANCAAWEIKGLIVRGAAAVNTAIVGTPTITVIDNTAAFGTPTITADTTNGCLTITVTGLAATNIRWNCTLRTTEVIYT